MKQNKHYIPASNQVKRDARESLYAILFWLAITVVLSILFHVLISNGVFGSYLQNLTANNTQLLYTAWTVQATVTVLAFFISNIMTSIVQEVFYGLSIKDILTSRVKWFEVSFWHQSIVCILLVIINGLFVLFQLEASVLVVTFFNLIFIIYMLNNAFSYVFNYRVIVNRVDKIIQKEILTGKTTLDINQLFISLENETKRRISSGELRRAGYNINFLIRIYESLTKNSKTEYLPQNLKAIKNILVYLMKNNAFELLDNALSKELKDMLEEDKYLEIIIALLEDISMRAMNYNLLEMEEYKVHEHLLNWSSLPSSHTFFVDSVASAYYNYYNSIVLNSKINNLIKNKLLTQLFETLTRPQKENKEQKNAFKIALLHITKDIVLNKNEQYFQMIINLLNQVGVEQIEFLEEISSLLNLYLYFIASNKNLNNSLNKSAASLLHLEADSFEPNKQTLAGLLQNSNAKFISYFWQTVDTILSYNTTSKLSIGNSSSPFSLNAVTRFYLIYWKLFANGLENISLQENESNHTLFHKTIQEFIVSVKEDEDAKYQNFKQFCEIYDLNYDRLKIEEHWTQNVDKIDDYIRDVYIDYLTSVAETDTKQLKEAGTKEQVEALIHALQETSKVLPLNKEELVEGMNQTLVLPFVFKAKKLKELPLTEEFINEYVNEYKDTIYTVIREYLLTTELKTIVYDKDRPNLNTVLEELKSRHVNAMTHKFSSNLDLLNNEKDTAYVPQLIEQEEGFTLLNQLEIDEYLFLNTETTSINFIPVKFSFRKPNKDELNTLLEGFKTHTAKNKDEYKIEGYYGTLEQATKYYEALYYIGDLTLDVLRHLDIETMLRVEMNKEQKN